ncbi:helix-turn-helix domain-containing protein [Herminiimonas fonticola]|uniref:Uncharacterized protein n=1 Tax=Herminiimonas fonticola TaxID=303380 RepID=A0A4V3BWH3_9BURK|nr:helix-turn-helix transcriptional regulator [Herminiimonas fonticola]RBA25495.1 hypothetical protein Hfont_1128 [Herminiimonas fonticola]TDN94608.1 hypothetical protein EV677_1159 [Herminiimonas fonticola]
MSPYGEKLSEFIRRENLQQKQFAVEIGVLPNHISQVLSGTKGPLLNQHEKIVKTLRLRASESAELLSLAEISNLTFRLPDDSQPIHYRIAALLCKKSHLESSKDKLIEIAQLALAEYVDSSAYRPIRSQEAKM